jgi:hypothetical protein
MMTVDGLQIPGGHEKPCTICGDPCNALAGNPDKWPVFLPRSGIPLYYHAGCLAESNAQIREENTRLRAALANSELPCAYCTLPAEKWGECQHGFPGCARGDDALGCPHFGAEMKYRELIGELRPHLDALNAEEERRAKWALGHPERDGFLARMRDDHVIISMTAGDWYKIRGIIDGNP